MSWRYIVATVGETLRNAIGSKRTAPSPVGISAAGLTAFVQFAGPIVRIIEGKGTLADDAAATNAVLDAIATFDPAAVPVVTLIEMAAPAFNAIVGLAKDRRHPRRLPRHRGRRERSEFQEPLRAKVELARSRSSNCLR